MDKDGPTMLTSELLPCMEHKPVSYARPNEAEQRRQCTGLPPASQAISPTFEMIPSLTAR